MFEPGLTRRVKVSQRQRSPEEKKAFLVQEQSPRGEIRRGACGTELFRVARTAVLLRKERQVVMA